MDIAGIHVADASSPSISNRLQVSFQSIHDSFESGDFRRSDEAIASTIALLDSTTESLSSDAEEALSFILSYLSSSSSSQMVVEALSLELPKVVVRLAGLSDECRAIAGAIVDRLVSVSSAREMLVVLCEALHSHIKVSKAPIDHILLLSRLPKAHLNTIKADSKGSKEDIYTSKVHYMLRRGRPYIWIPEGELHNTNAIIDERASLAVSSNVPGPLMSLLRSIRKFSARVALTGDLIALKEEKVHRVAESLRESILMEYNLANQASYTVSALLSSAGASCRSRCENFLEILGESDKYAVYKFDINSCTYIDGSGRAHDLDNEEITAPKADEISLFTEKLIDGINQSQARRRALMLFCFEYHNASARDALMLSIDRKGFDILAKVPEVDSNQNQQYNWKEFRFTFKEEASDIESFCRLLVELEEEALESVKSYSGLG